MSNEQCVNFGYFCLLTIKSCLDETTKHNSQTKLSLLNKLKEMSSHDSNGAAVAVQPKHVMVCGDQKLGAMRKNTLVSSVSMCICVFSTGKNVFI